MTRYSRPMMLLLVLACLSVTMLATSSGTSEAAQWGVTLKRHSKDLAPKAPKTEFGDPAADSCSGWCDCDFCGCSGSDSCCDSGCDACWAYRDSRGYCGSLQ